MREAEEVGRHVAVRKAVDTSFAVRIGRCLSIGLRIANVVSVRYLISYPKLSAALLAGFFFTLMLCGCCRRLAQGVLESLLSRDRSLHGQ